MSPAMLGIIVGSAVCVCTFLGAMANEDMPAHIVRRGFWGGYMLALGSLGWALIA